jgi:hypothetical protein
MASRPDGSFEPGQMWVLPPRTTPLPGDSDAHPHFLLAPQTEGAWAVMVLGTGSDAELAHGASGHIVTPSDVTPDGRGLTKTTHFYGGVLVPYPMPMLNRPMDGLAEELPAVREVVKAAIGCGTGEHWNYKPPYGGAPSWRGKIVQLRGTARKELDTPFAVILTEHEYSASKRWQVLVPLYDEAEFEPTHADTGVRIARPWVSSLLDRPNGALLTWGSLVRSLWHDRQLIGEPTRHTVERRDLALIEADIRRSLLLDEHATNESDADLAGVDMATEAAD